MDAANLSKTCRICCHQRKNDLVSLLDADNKAIIKKMRACADVTIEHDDLLPKYICIKCLQNLNLAYNFKIQCEFMDQKMRESISCNIQKHSVSSYPSTNDLSRFDNDSDDNAEVSSSYDYSSSGHHTLDDIDTMIDDECIEDEETMEDEAYLGAVQNESNENDTGESSSAKRPKLDMESNLMEISQKIADIQKFDSTATVSAREPDDCTDQEMFSVKSDNMSSPKIKSKEPYSCETCGEGFYVHSEYIKHAKRHGKMRFQCQICHKWFAKRYLCNAHQKTHTGAKNFQCSLCTRRYTSQTNLDRHIRVFHQNQRPYTCTTCNKSFSQLSSLKLHQSVHVAEREFGCDICNGKFKTEVQLKLHKKRHLPTEYRPKRKYTPPKKPYKAPPPKPCSCKECGKKMNSLALLRSHMRTHSVDKKYKCTFCEKRFSFQQSLRNHVYVHTGEKRFKCETCGISFRQLGHLQGHRLIHSGVKPHTCSVCGKTFALRGNLTVHMRMHTGATPFQCTICSKKFSDSNGLKRHLTMHERKNQSNPVIEEILALPIIEAPLTEPLQMPNQIFDNTAQQLNTESVENVQFFAPPYIESDNPQDMYQI